MTPEDWETTARAEVRKAQGEFHARLAAIRSKVESHGADSNAFFLSTALFDGPPPAPLAKGALAESFRMCGSRDELLRSIRLPAGSSVCELGVWKGAFTRRILDHLAPATCHLFDLTFAPLDPAVRSHPAVVLHEGDSGAAIASLPDASVDFAYVDGDHSYQGARRDLFGVFPKVKPGGLIQVNDYTPWSVLSGFPYGVMAGVHELLNGGGCTLIGFGLHPFGHHDLLIRKS
jgi:hypothetical protein